LISTLQIINLKKCFEKFKTLPLLHGAEIKTEEKEPNGVNKMKLFR
jgi:hypothetical protein